MIIRICWSCQKLGMAVIAMSIKLTRSLLLRMARAENKARASTAEDPRWSLNGKQFWFDWELS